MLFFVLLGGASVVGIVGSLVLLIPVWFFLRKRKPQDQGDNSTSIWVHSALSWLRPVYLIRIYTAPVILICLFLPWALETRKPLLVAGFAELKTGWELQGLGILVPLIAVILLSLYFYLARPARPRLVFRCIFAGLAILALQIEIELAGTIGFLDFTATVTDYQPAYLLASMISSLYLFSVFVEAGILIWKYSHPGGSPAPALSAVPPGQQIAADAQSQDIILLIHGTGAGADEDRGSAWWQVGSEFASVLEESLPPGVRVHREGEVFHWSAKNSEAERRYAGNALFEYLCRLAKDGINVHLVGHSHGGSVILYALKRAVARHTPLTNLRSWTTLGTPFIHYSVDLSNAPLLLVPIVGAALLLLPGSLTDHIIEAWPRLIEEGYYLTVVAIAAFGAVIGLFVFFNLWKLLRLLFAQLYQRRTRRIETTAMSRYGELWKCIWSESDEAIGGLQRATGFVGELILPIPSEETSLTGRLRAALSAPVRLFFNYIGRPVLNDSISRRLRKLAQGNDVGIAEVYDISPWPRGGRHWSHLPVEIETQAVEVADRYGAESVRALRALLGTSVVAPLEVSNVTIAVTGRLSGRELVHCGYYHIGAVTAEIAGHIASHSGEAEPARSKPVLDGGTSPGDVESPHAGAPGRSSGVWIVRGLAAGLQLVVLASVVGLLHLVDNAVLDRFRWDRQVKESLYSSMYAATRASLETGNIDAILDFRREMKHAGWSLSGDPRIDLAGFAEQIEEKRFGDAENMLKTFRNPFYATTVYTIYRGAGRDKVDPKDLALSPELNIDMQPFIDIAPAVGRAGVLDELVASAMRLRGSPMNPDPLEVGIRKIFGRLDWGWLTDSTTASARRAGELSLLHLRAWAGNREARSELVDSPENGATISRLSILEMILKYDAPVDAELDDTSMEIALAIARSPYSFERRELAPLLIRYGRWHDVIRLAERLRNAPAIEYGSSLYFDQFRYFALTSGLEAHARNEIPEEDWQLSPYPLSQLKDLHGFPDDVRDKADKIRKGIALDSYETVGSLDGLETYGLLEVVRNHLASGLRTQALQMARTALEDLRSGRGSAHPEAVQADEFKRLAVIFAEAGDLYQARRIGDAFVPRGERLEVWTAIIESYRKLASPGDGDYAAHISALWKEVDRERGMLRGFDALWNDNRW